MPRRPDSVDLQRLCETEFQREDDFGRRALDAAQFRRALTQVLLRLSHAPPPTGPWFDALFVELDTNSDGLVDESQFEQAVERARHVVFHSHDAEWRAYASDAAKQAAADQQRLAELAVLAAAGASRARIADAALADIYDIADGITLGEGSFGRVVQVRHRLSGELRACKVMEISSPHARELVELEVSLLKALDHVALLQLYEVFQEGPSRVCLVTELCAGGSLAERLAYHREAVQTPMAESQVATYTEQLLSAAGYCHQRGIVHRDLKPENVLFLSRAASSPLKVIDFGLSETVDRLQNSQRYETAERGGVMGAVAQVLSRLPVGAEVMSTQAQRLAMQRAGTPHYMAPEVYQGQYGPKADVWAIGCMTFEMLVGKHPFFVQGTDDFESVRRKILEHRDVTLDSLARLGLSSQGVVALRRMLNHDPQQRMSARAALEEPWFTGVSRLATQGTRQLSVAAAWAGLRSFVSSGLLRQLVLRALARELSEDQVQELRGTFLQLDKDRDGVLSAEDIIGGLQRTGSPVDAAEIRAAVAQIGTCYAATRSGVSGLGYTDFVAALLPQRVVIRPQQIACAFERFDVRGEGCITSAALHAAVSMGSARGFTSLPPSLLSAAAAELAAASTSLDLPGFARLAVVAADANAAGQAVRLRR
mmetsp:Transcript_30733/g.102347  ORF Transcript_30733/g.102347 Transcript_30733/m.102347 type:complete len:652 (-) Transcript_30733:203-2158(-)